MRAPRLSRDACDGCAHHQHHRSGGILIGLCRGRSADCKPATLDSSALAPPVLASPSRRGFLIGSAGGCRKPGRSDDGRPVRTGERRNRLRPNQRQTGPDAGEDYTALAAKFPTPPASAGLVKSGGFAQLSEEAFLRDFAGDIEPAKARILHAVQGRISDTLFSGKTTEAAWRSKPSWYAISTEDRTISPELERFMADRMKARTIEVKASHLSLISRPQEITDLILDAAGRAG
jgi:hypothetical protein